MSTRTLRSGISTSSATDTRIQQTETDIQTTVITINSCSNNKCAEVPVTTGLTTVTEVDTIFTTYCPLSTNTVVPTGSGSGLALQSPTTSITASITLLSSSLPPNFTVDNNASKLLPRSLIPIMIVIFNFAAF